MLVILKADRKFRPEMMLSRVRRTVRILRLSHICRSFVVHLSTHLSTFLHISRHNFCLLMVWQWFDVVNFQWCLWVGLSVGQWNSPMSKKQSGKSWLVLVNLDFQSEHGFGTRLFSTRLTVLLTYARCYINFNISF